MILRNSPSRPAILDRLEAAKMVVFSKGELNLNIVVERMRPGKPNAFDDLLHIVYRKADPDGLTWRELIIKCTADPGTFYAKNPMNIRGTATLMPGQYRGGWKLGLHHGQYEALVQAKPLMVWRDRDKDGQPDRNGPMDVGMFGINLHHASTNHESTVVDKWSAGCVVVADPKDFAVILGLFKESAKLYGPNFTFTVLETVV